MPHPFRFFLRNGWDTNKIPVYSISENARVRLCKSEFVSYASLMTIDSILAQIDAEIAKLTQVRSLLANTGKVSATVTERATKKIKKARKAKKAAKAIKAAPVAKAAKTKKRRTLSPEARQRIAEAQRKRWAAQKAK